MPPEIAVVAVLSVLSLIFFFARCRLNLEKTPSKYVLETRKLHIPGHPEAYNGSLVRWRGQWLLSFREKTSRRRSSLNYLIWLDEEFTPQSPSVRLPLPLEAEDIRLIADNDRLYFVYTHAGDWMSVGELECSRFQISVAWTRRFANPVDGRMEKNWTPFVSGGRLQFIYSMQPHAILDENGKETVFHSDVPAWLWGEMRGGTPALRLDEGRYITFFHSQQMMCSSHSYGLPSLHYFIGAYTFSLQAPYPIQSMSAEPIVGADFYRGPKHYDWNRNPVNVVYPCGLAIDEQFVWVSYGRQDCELWIMKLDRQGLMESLCTTSTPSQQTTFLV